MGSYRPGQLPRVCHLGENCDQVGPTEAAEAALLHIPVAGAAPGLRAIAPAVDVLAADGSIESAESLTDLAVGLLVDEVASRGGAHLALGLLNEEGLGSSHKGGAGGTGDGSDVASNESVVGGGDDGGHILSCLRVKLRFFHWDKDMTFIQYMQIFDDFF